eukprot:TRINITY_DN19312_c0_g1_i1.p1 TRINITY_DN19312_c0_g1~~TRINITY_DN19312_c0_g1_i1.p1  ORF type:complete len:393 (+),score=26.71 TRINITY_DN19312_c0_g1_i1:33-1211(+)
MPFRGHLKKNCHGKPDQYRVRWFVLNDANLAYYKHKGDAKPIASFSIRDGTIEPTPSEPNGLTISGMGVPRRFHLLAASADDKDAWINALQEEQLKGTISPRGAQPVGDATAGGVTIGLKDFAILKIIGQGTFGKVLKVKLIHTGDVYAMKVMRKDEIKRQNMIINTKNEKLILQQLDHPYIVKLHFAFHTKDRLYLCLDLLSGGELFDHLSEAGAFSLERSKLYAAQIASGLHEMHKKHICYRDLKPENIVLDKDNHACITDFGIAKTDLKIGRWTNTFCGTPEYIAPEMLQKTGHDRGVDWWALGILLYEMLCGIPPFYSEEVEEMYDNIQHADIDWPDHVGDDARDLIVKLLDKDKNKRLKDGEKVMKHPFFDDIDWQKLMHRQLPCPP